MSEADQNLWGGPAWANLAARCAALMLIVIAGFPIAGFYLNSQFGPPGWRAAAVAAGVCGFGSTAALLLTGLVRGPNRALFSLLFGMLLRMGLPLGVGMWLSRSSPELAAGGVFGAILAFYLVTLLVETLLVLPLVAQSARRPT